MEEALHEKRYRQDESGNRRSFILFTHIVVVVIVNFPSPQAFALLTQITFSLYNNKRLIAFLVMYFGEWKAGATTDTDLPHVLGKDQWSVCKMVKLVNMALESGSIHLQSNDQGRERGMKKRWEAPRLEVEQFMTNDSVSACGDSGRIYSFECNAGQAGHEYAVYSLGEWGRKNYQVGDFPYSMDGFWGKYQPCGETHSAPDNSGFFTGYYIDDVWTVKDERIPVVVWTNNGTNVHCTTNLNINEWEVNRS